MASILGLIQEFCYRINVPAPSAIAGVSSPTEQQYLGLFRTIGANLLFRPYQWPQLKAGYTFTTQTGVSRYQLPPDFFRILDSSQWDVSNAWPLRGPVSDFQYATRRFSVVSLQTRKAFRIVGPIDSINRDDPNISYRSSGYFEIDPAGENDTDELFLGYLSYNWCKPRDWVASTAYTQGQVVTGANDRMYRCSVAGTSGSTIPSVASGTVVDGTVTWIRTLGRYGIGMHDEDRCLFDDNLMIEGMQWAYYRAKRQPYENERSDWEQMVKSAYARFNGPVRISMSDEYGDCIDWPNIPAGSWSV
jgi:hypothetical protein